MLLLILKDGGWFDAPLEPSGAAVGHIVEAGRTMKFGKSMLIGLLFSLLISCRGVSNFSVLLAPEVVLHNGKIVERGKHTELLVKEGLYHKMFMMQQGTML